MFLFHFNTFTACLGSGKERLLEVGLLIFFKASDEVSEKSKSVKISSKGTWETEQILQITAKVDGRVTEKKKKQCRIS